MAILMSVPMKYAIIKNSKPYYMNRNLLLKSYTLLACLSMYSALQAQVTTSKRLPGSTTLPAQSVKKIVTDTSSKISQTAASCGSTIKNNPVTASPAGQLQMKDYRNTQPGKKYTDPNYKAPANPVLNGIYYANSIINGTKVTKIFNLKSGLSNSYAAIGNNKAPVEPTSKGAIKIISKNPSANKNNESWDCQNEMRKVSLNDQGYLTLDVASQITKVLPGRAYHFQKYINGSWDDDVEDNRKPFRISCSNPNINGKVTEEIADVREGTLRQAVANIYSRFPADPAKVASLTFSMFAEEVHNTAELNVRIGAGGYGFGFSADNLFSFSEKSSKRTFFVDITKTLFTIDVEHPSGGLFTDPSVNTSDIMYMASVTYGIRILASIELDIKDETTLNQFNGKYNGLAYGGYINADVFANDVKNQATVKFFVVGGTSNSVTPAYNIADMQKQIVAMTKDINYNTCHPIRYSFKNNNGEVVSYASATDYFNYRNCEPPGENMKPAKVSVRISDISLKNMDQDDVDLYGTIWANVYKADNGFLPPVENQYHLMSLPANLHLRSDNLKKGDYRFGYGRTIEFDFNIGEAAGAVLYIYFDLIDEDDSPDDPIVMPNLPKFPIKMQDGSTRNFYGLKINLDAVQKTLQGGQTFNIDCVDYEGDYPFTIGITVEKK